MTGGLGFVGSHLCRALSERGYRVVCVDRLAGTYANGCGPDARSSLAAAGVRVVVADAAGPEVAAIARDCDAVLHLAALSGVRCRHSARDLQRENVAVAARVSRLAAAAGARFVLASTSSVYGDAAVPAHEDSPRVPLNAYAASKVAAEDACSADAVVARLFTVYGPGQRPDMAFTSWIDAITRDEPIRWCASEGARRDFTFVGDAVRGLIAALEHGRPGRAYNIGGGGPVRVDVALGELEWALARRARRRIVESGVAEARVTAACGARAERELGYRPLTSLREGIRAQVAAAAPLALTGG